MNLPTAHCPCEQEMRKRGFTLVELAVVLVIVGLVIGGVLVGKDMITTAYYRNAISDTQKFATAALTFKLKYACLPGDCTSTQASTFGISAYPGTSSNGNNNGSVCERSTSMQIPITIWPERHECRNFWYHLSQTKLINWQPTPGGYCTDATLIKLGEATPPLPGVSAANGDNTKCAGWLLVGRNEMNVGANPISNSGHAFLIVGGFGNSPAIASGTQAPASPTMTTIAPEMAFHIDTKLDDSLPNSGKVRAVGFYQDVSQPNSTRDLSEPYRGSSGGRYCINNTTTPNSYNVATSVKTCNLSIESDF